MHYFKLNDLILYDMTCMSNLYNQEELSLRHALDQEMHLLCYINSYVFQSNLDTLIIQSNSRTNACTHSIIALCQKISRLVKAKLSESRAMLCFCMLSFFCKNIEKRLKVGWREVKHKQDLRKRRPYPNLRVPALCFLFFLKLSRSWVL